MCVAIFVPEGKKIKNPERIFDNCKRGNDDGFGMLWVVDGKLNCYKSLEYNAFKAAYDKVSQLNNTPIVLHFRAGSNPVYVNCHPFMVNPDTGFVHNGYISGVTKEGIFSDTYQFNEVLKKMYHSVMDNESVQKLIELFVGNHNKLIFLNSKKKHFIVNESKGKWSDGIWYSNEGFKSVKSSYNRRYYGGAITVTCDICKKDIDDKESTKVSQGEFEIDICPKCLPNKRLSLKYLIRKFF